MTRAKSVADWMQERNIDLDGLVDSSGLDRRVVEAVIAGRYTPSPQQRKRVANALHVEPDEIRWGHATHVDHMYGHGPQFGRSP